MSEETKARFLEAVEGSARARERWAQLGAETQEEMLGWIGRALLPTRDRRVEEGLQAVEDGPMPTGHVTWHERPVPPSPAVLTAGHL